MITIAISSSIHIRIVHVSSRSSPSSPLEQVPTTAHSDGGSDCGSDDGSVFSGGDPAAVVSGCGTGVTDFGGGGGGGGGGPGAVFDGGGGTGDVDDTLISSICSPFCVAAARYASTIDDAVDDVVVVVAVPVACCGACRVRRGRWGCPATRTLAATPGVDAPDRESGFGADDVLAGP